MIQITNHYDAWFKAEYAMRNLAGLKHFKVDRFVRKNGIWSVQITFGLKP